LEHGYALEKFNEDSGIDTGLVLDHEPHLASRGDRRDEAHAKACAGGFHGRRFAFLAPTTPRVVIRAHVGASPKKISASELDNTCDYLAPADDPQTQKCTQNNYQYFINISCGNKCL
jgi:hypothetical protein